LLCTIVQVRELSGQNRGKLIDCKTLNGEAFCLPGHTALLSKVELLKRNNISTALVHHLGRVKNYEDYEVQGWTGTLEELMRDPDAQKAYEDTERAVESSRKLSGAGLPSSPAADPPGGFQPLQDRSGTKWG
jgi:hypothetical protein